MTYSLGMKTKRRFPDWLTVNIEVLEDGYYRCKVWSNKWGSKYIGSVTASFQEKAEEDVYKLIKDERRFRGLPKDAK